MTLKSLTNIRIIPQLDTYPRLVGFAQRPAGKIALAAAFALALQLQRRTLSLMPLEIAVGAALMAFFPQRRRILLSAAALYWVLAHGVWLKVPLVRMVAAAEGLQAGRNLTFAMYAVLAVVFVAFGGYLRCIRKQDARSPGLIRRHPVFLMFAAFLLWVAFASTIPLHGLPRLAACMVPAVVAPYLWYFAYAAVDSASKAPDPYGLQFGTFFPFWVGWEPTSTPIGKCAAALRKAEVRNPQELAIVQLKAIKLLMWLFLLRVVSFAFQTLVHGPTHLAAPTLGAALDQTAAGIHVPVHIAWLTVVSHFIEGILRVTLSGNTIVACCRMAGFKVLRNTYKPLYSTSIGDFWNRFYYYFKELLVDFFFYPVYLRYFKRHLRLRLAVATLAAATFGNALYHFCRDVGYVFTMGVWKAVAGFQVYAFYTLVLGVGIAISQWTGKPVLWETLPWYRRILAAGRVLGFYCLLEIFDYEERTRLLRTHLTLLCRLFIP